MRLTHAYYLLKPLLPRWAQIRIRRMYVQFLRSACGPVWPIDERACAAPAGWRGWPEGRRFALVLTHDVETARGQARCLRLLQVEQARRFRSSFNFVAESYPTDAALFAAMRRHGYELGLHGLHHRRNPFRSRRIFSEQAPRINRYLRDWNAAGFRAPCMYHNLEWMHDLHIEYDASTFDTDPFEPQPDGVCTIFPFWVAGTDGRTVYLELPYTLPQDFTLFILLRETTIDIWKRKLDWIVSKGGMALLITHPDYMAFEGERPTWEEYPASLYEEFLDYVQARYGGQYWNPLPREMARHWKESLNGWLNPAEDVAARALAA